jgi:hypothetical protein
VERGSTQHSHRLDDALADEVEPLVRSGREPRASEDRLHEPEADDEPTPDSRVSGRDGPPMPGLLDLDEIEARSMLAASLRPSAFPADREELQAVADSEHAPPDVLEALRTLPPGIRFVNVQQVWEALGGEREQRDGTSRAAAAPTETTEPLDVEVEIELEVEALRSAVDSGPEVPRTDGDERAEPEAAGGPWWASPLRTGFSLATLPLRIGVGVVRAVAERVRR